MGVQSVGGYRKPRTHVALSSVPGSTFSCALSSAVPRQDGTAGPDKEKAGRARLFSIELSDLSKKSSRRNVVNFIGEGVTQ